MFSSCTIGWIKSENVLLKKGLEQFPADKWYQLGVALGVPVDELKTIQSGYIMLSGGVKRCLSETLEWWYRNTPGGATWSDLCVALHAVDERALAKKVAKDHGNYM